MFEGDENISESDECINDNLLLLCTILDNQDKVFSGKDLNRLIKNGNKNKCL